MIEIALDSNTRKVSLGREKPGLSFLTRGYRILFIVDIDSTPEDFSVTVKRPLITIKGMNPFLLLLAMGENRRAEWGSLALVK